eukprot:gi/632945048/ref/XP_007887840.1/ PREDICTED: bromodomain-containing protein 9 isoform X3 [Callorhinchus milii]
MNYNQITSPNVNTCFIIGDILACVLRFFSFFKTDFIDKPTEKPLKLVLKVGGSEVTELSGSGHDSSYYDDRSDHDRERHKEKKKKKKKKSEKEKDKHISDEDRRRRKEEKKRKREKEHVDSEADADEFDPGKRVEVEPPTDRPVRSCRTKEHVENENTPLQQLLEHFLRQLQRKDPHGFFAFPVTDSIAPGYSMIIKHPMDFSTMKDKILTNDYNSITEFKADFKLMCDNAMTYNRPETVYYKAAKKLLHTGFKMMSKAALLGDEDTGQEETVAEVTVVPVETTTKKSKKQSKEVISYLYEPEGTACSSTDSTAEEHVLALVEHAADEARDRISRHAPNSKIGYLKKEGDGALLFAVVNQSDPDTEAVQIDHIKRMHVHNSMLVVAEEEIHQVDLSSLTTKLQPGINTMGFKDDRRNKALSVTYLNCVYTAQSIQNNTVFPNLTPEETELLYSTYGEETGVQCALSLQEFVKDCGGSTKKMVDDLLNQMTGGEHCKAVYHLAQKRNIEQKASKDIKLSLDEVQIPAVFIKEEPKMQPTCPETSKPIVVGGASGSTGENQPPVLDFMPLKSYSDVSLDISLLTSLGKSVKKEPDHDDNQRNLDETTKLLQDLHEAQTERVGSRPSSNLSSISSNSDREQHHLGSPPHLNVGEQGDLVQDFREFLQAPANAAAGNLNRSTDNS